VHYLDCTLYIYKLKTTYLNTGFPVNVSIIRVLFSIALCTANASWKKCFRFHFKNMTLDWMHLVNSVDLCILSQETVSWYEVMPDDFNQWESIINIINTNQLKSILINWLILKINKNQSCNVEWFSIFIDFHWLSLIVIDFYWKFRSGFFIVFNKSHG